MENPNAQAQFDASKHFLDLKNAGRIPGFQTNTPGVLISAGINLDKRKTSYLHEAVFQVVKKEEADAIYWYVLQRERQDQNWELGAAWKTDVKGREPVQLLQQNAVGDGTR